MDNGGAEYEPTDEDLAIVRAHVEYVHYLLREDLAHLPEGHGYRTYLEAHEGVARRFFPDL